MNRAVATSCARRAASARRACSRCFNSCSASASASVMFTGPPALSVRASASSIASSLTFPPRISALVISLCRPALPTKSTTRHDGFALAAIAAHRSSDVSGPSTTPGSGRVERPTICEYSDRLFVGRPMITTSTPGSSKPSVSTPQLHTT